MLFYWTLASETSHKKQKHSAVNEWASQISHNAKPAFRAPTSRSTSSRAKSSILSLTGDTTRLSTSASSVLSKNVKITICQPLDSKAEPAPDLVPDLAGGLSDNDETKGEERMAAINSPLKGKKRVNSEV
jgi:hypothetical protein